MMNFSFGTNGKFIVLGVPILKYIRVSLPNSTIPDNYGKARLENRNILTVPVTYSVYSFHLSVKSIVSLNYMNEYLKQAYIT